jgi:hypothetical protein
LVIAVALALAFVWPSASTPRGAAKDNTDSLRIAQPSERTGPEKGQASTKDRKPASTPEPTPPHGVRIWHDSSGQFSVEAEFVGYDQGRVRLRKPDGRTVLILREKLCAADREYLRELERARGPENKSLPER